MNNKIQLVLNIFFALGFVILIAMQFNSTERLAVVNTSLLMEKYEGMKEVGEKLRAQSAQWQQKIDTLSMDLEASVKEYEKKVAKMSVNEQKIAREAIGKKQTDLLHYQEIVKQKKDEEDQRIIGGVLKDINEFLIEYGKKNNYTLILAGSNGSVAYAKESIDVTQDVIEQLNKKYSKE